MGRAIQLITSSSGFELQHDTWLFEDETLNGKRDMKE